jgi:hypothetical protein
VENLQVGGICDMYGGDGRCTRKFSSKNGNKGKLGKKVVALEDGKELLKWIGCMWIKTIFRFTKLLISLIFSLEICNLMK